MITSQDKQFISRLVKKYAGNMSTGAMIAFVADTNGMLSVCKTLVNCNNNDDQATISWVDEQCHDRNVDVRGFLYEVEQILFLFQPGHQVDDYYSVLNLESGASEEEIKNAYRQLSRKYHPDTAPSAEATNGEMFDQVTKAYHSLLNDKTTANNLSAISSTNNWREQKNKYVSREQKRKYLFWFSVLAVMLIVVSLIVASNYRQKVMIAGLQSTRAALIPPDLPVSLFEDEKKQVEEEVLDSVTETMWNTANIPVEKQTRVTENVNQEIDKQILLPEKIQSRPDEKKTTVFPIQTNVVKSVKKIEKIVTLDTETMAQVKEVKRRSTESVASKENTSVKQDIAEKSEKEKQVVTITIAEDPLSVSTVRENQENTQKKIEDFLFKYVKSYENKDLLSFARFFDLDAIENGEPLAEILPTYSDLFQKSDTIILDISLLKWENYESGLSIEGRFKIYIRYKVGNKVQGTGSISFLMHEVEQQLFIKETTYHFDKKK